MFNSPILPKVSFLVGCYNHGRFVMECLSSIEAQDYGNIEIIIWDDFSTDDSVFKIESWLKTTSTACFFIKSSKNTGLCKSLNMALSKATGKYIAITAADDVQMTGRIQRHVEILEKAPATTGVVYSDAINISIDGAVMGSKVLDPCQYQNYPSGNVFNMIFCEKFIPPSMATLFKKECIDQVGNYDESMPIEDYDMWLRISNKYDFAYDSHPAAMYRTVDSSLSRNPNNFKKISNSCKESRIKSLDYTLLNKSQKKTAVKDIMDLCKYEYSNGDTPKCVLRKKLLASVFSINPKEIIFAISVILGVPPKIYYRMHSILGRKAGK